jgi:hypothetical protein
MGSEGWRNSKPQESVPPNSVPPESIPMDAIPASEGIANLIKKMQERRASRGGMSGEISFQETIVPEETDSQFDNEKIPLGAGRISIIDYKTITLNTKSEKSSNKYVLRRGAGVYTLFNVRAKSITEIDFSKIQELDLSLGKPFVYGRNREGKKIQTAVVISGEGTLLEN